MIERFLAHYWIVKKLGEGGMGEVYLAQDADLGRAVVLKFPLADSGSYTERYERTSIEARAAAALNHPNIAHIYSVEQADGRTFITMEYVEGVQLGERVHTGGLPLKTFFKWAIALADALAHAHEQGVVHRDIKPSNVMVSREDVPKILDFGLARIDRAVAVPGMAGTATALTADGVVLGTAPYMSPEQAEGKPVDHRTDIFSFGALMYEMLTGSRPFKGDTAVSVISSILKDTPDSVTAVRPDVPPAVARIVLRSLEKDRQRRYQSMRDVAVELEEAKVASVSSSTSSAAALAAARLVSRALRPRVAGIAAVTLLIAAIALGLARPWNRRAASAYSSVALLPLTNASAAPADTDYLADGLSEALITRLSQVGGLRVTPWITAQYYKKPRKPPQALAGELGVDAVITGTLRKYAGRISVTVSLIDGKSGFQVAGDEFDEPADDLLAVQSRISVSAARTLRARLTRAEEQALNRPAAKSAEAYEFYLRANATMRVSSKESCDTAAALYEKALALDANLAEAHAGLAVIGTERFYYGWGHGLADVVDAEAAAKRALSINPALRTAQRQLVRIYGFLGRAEDALKIGKQVAETGASDAESLSVRANGYYTVGLWDKVIPLAQRIIEIDPGNRSGLGSLQGAYAGVGRYRDALAALQAYFERFGEFPEFHMNAAMCHFALGEQEQARREFEKHIALAPNDFLPYVFYGSAENVAGRRDRAIDLWRKGVATLERKIGAAPRNPRLRVWLAQLYAYLGEAGKARDQEIIALADEVRTGGNLMHLGLAHLALGDEPRANELLTDALEAGGAMPDMSEMRLYSFESFARSSDYQRLRTRYEEKLKRFRAIY